MKAECHRQQRWVVWSTANTHARVALAQRCRVATNEDADLTATLDALGLEPVQRQELVASIMGPLYLDDTVEQPDNSERTVAEVIAAPEPPEDEGWTSAVDDPAAVINAALRALEPRQRWIIVRYFGLNGKERLSLEQIGREYGVTRERIRQLKDLGLAALREAMLASGAGDLAAEVAAEEAQRQALAQHVTTSGASADTSPTTHPEAN
jgi:RNA polymerase sigma factor (sigma-70 family)